MENETASAGASLLTGNSFKSGSLIASVLSDGTSARGLSLNASLSFPPPPVPWSEPPVPSPLPHPPLVGPLSPARRSSPLNVRFGEPTPPSPSFSAPLPVSNLTSSSSIVSSSSSTSPSSVSTTHSSNSTSSISSAATSPVRAESPPVPSEDPSGHDSPRNNASSPTYSTFVSASGSPFFSPTSSASTPFVTPPTQSFVQSSITTPRERTFTPRPNPATLLSSPHRKPPFSPPPSVFSPNAPLSRNPYNAPSMGSSVASAPYESPNLLLQTAASPSSAGRPRSCDVFVGSFGQNPALLRFSKWMRAELELQGVACFSADRSLYSDMRSHDSARRIITSATFGVVIICKNVFGNPWTIEELRLFMERKNLVPIFFDLAPSDCLSRDIVERRGKIWEKYGGELWTLYDGDENEWRGVVEGLVRVEDWRLEAFHSNWRSCIQKAVALVVSRLGRKSIAERERCRRERDDPVEFPYPRNASFVGREKELKILEELLFLDREEESSEAFRSNDPRLVRKAKVDSGVEVLREEPGGKIFRRLDTLHIQSGDSQWLDQRGKDRQTLGTQLKYQIESDREPFRGVSGRDHQRGRQLQRERHSQRKREAHNAKEHVDPSVSPRHGFACISGVSGIGKTELALEYAYRNSQKYRMVLWVGGENRYIRQNYLHLSVYLGTDVSTETQVGPDRGRIKSFDEQETNASHRVRIEFLRDIPYLLIIDNLESERDWWDGKEISEMLPVPGGASHVIITTRLSRVIHFETMELSYLSGLEALSLMRGNGNFSAVEQDALKEIEDKLCRLPLGLGIVGKLLSELPMTPSELLERINKAEGMSELRDREDAVLRNNPYIYKLLNVCFSLLDTAEGPRKLAERMALVGGWFAPSLVPTSLLAQSASKFRDRTPGLKCLGSCTRTVFWCCVATQTRRVESVAASLLIKYGITNPSSREGFVYFHEIVQVYARRRGGIPAAKAVVQGVRKGGSVILHLEHFWAASFLVLRFGNDPATLELKVTELLSFSRKVVLPLALRSFTAYTRCQAALELLHLCYNMLEDIDKSFVSQIQDWWDKSLCFRRGGIGSNQVDEYVWQELTLLKALLLETRAKLMLRGGHFDAGEEVCRTCVSIRTVMLGPEHPDTLAAQEILAKLIRYRNNL